MFDQSAENPSAAKQMAQGGIIAVLYVILTFVFAPISFGAVQVRIAEALTILPLFTPAAVPGLFIGCLLANIFGGGIIWDVIFGSIATLIGAVLGRMLRSNRWLVPIPLLVLYIAIGEIAGCYVLGELLAEVIIRRKGMF